MKNRLFLAALILFATAPVFAQAPKGWKVRVDRSTNASDPDAAGSIKLTTTASGFRADTPQAAVFWNPANTAAGNYTLKATFKLLKPFDEEYYGLIFGGSNLDGAGQSYLYFEISDDGTWLVKRRAGSSAPTISERTSNAAIKKPGADGMSTNTLEVRVTADKVAFAVNGTVVSTMPKTGQMAKTDGIYGFRSNHHLEVEVDGLTASKQ